jgi:hypothetical protein
MALDNGHTTSKEVYVHQISRLREDLADEYFAAVQEEQIPLMASHNVRLVGLWQGIPEQGSWPEIIEIWEYDDMPHCSNLIRIRSESGALGKQLKDWARRRSKWVSSTEGLICTRSAGSPTVAQLAARNSYPVVTLHETIEVLTGRQREYAELVEAFMKPRIMDLLQRELIGIYYSIGWHARRVINVWGVAKSWDDFMLIKREGLAPGDAAAWRYLAPALRTDYRDRFLIPAGFLSRTG